MVAPLIGAALVSGASSLLGGLLGRSSNKYVVPNYQQIRDKAEAAGFNPLTALAMAPGQVVQSQNFMGSAIADAGLSLADGMVAKHREDGALAKLAEENDKLREKVQNMTLRPKVGGVYAQREGIPSISQAVGGANGQTAGSVSGTVNASGRGSGGVGSAAGSHTALGDLIDPSRAVDPVKITSDPGVGIISNRWLGEFPVPLVNGEIPDILQYPTIAGSFLGYHGSRAALAIGGALRNKTDSLGWTTDGENYLTGFRADRPKRSGGSLSHPGQTGDAWWKSQRVNPFSLWR